MADSVPSGGRRYVVIAVATMLLAALPFSPLVSFQSSKHIDSQTATSDSNLPTKDSDNDGMPDWWEMLYNLNPFDASDADDDTDMDGHDRNGDGKLSENENFTNLMEYEMEQILGNSTDPTNPDSDNDGMPDGWEIFYNLNPISNLDADLDFDEDGYDNDRNGIISSAEEFTNLEEYLAGTSPWLPDSDSDVMTDGWEIYYDFNPVFSADAWFDNDTDGWDANHDYVLSFEERYLNYMEFLNGTNPLDKDTDNDEMSDGWEIFYDLDPLDPSDNFGDYDGDLLQNLYEYNNSLVNTGWIDVDGLLTTRPDLNDTDLDGITDNDELFNYLTDPTSNDTDSDGMPDGWEVKYGLNPISPHDADEDLDNDGWDFNRNFLITSDENFTNLQEYLNGTDPTDNDTDSDGMLDGWEAFYGLRPTDPKDSDEDFDNDGYDSNRDGFVSFLELFTNIEEFLNNTSPNNNDTDADTMSDGWEIHYNLNPLDEFDATIDFDDDGFDSNFNSTIEDDEEHPNKLEFAADTNPYIADTDSDGMLDGWEWRYGLNPLDSGDAIIDSDGDGLTNLQEYDNSAAGIYLEVDNITTTLPQNNDTDGDGLLDGDEIFSFLTDPTSSDTDADGIPDGWEIKYSLDPRDPSDAHLDSDNDGFDADWNGTLTSAERFSNLHEYLNNTDPTNGDTDGDGMSDGWEVYWNFQPLNSSDANDDPDNDSLINLYEFNNSNIEGFDENVFSSDNIMGSNPLLRDTDLDFISDGEECFEGEDGYVTDPSDPDSDDDGMADGWELLYEFNPFDPSDSDLDSDNDGWDFNRNKTIDPWERYTNYEEFLNGTNPRDNDTDGDDMPDGWEAYYGLDPNLYDDRNWDSDSDGYDSDNDGDLSPDEKFTNYEEFLMDTNPTQPDTDGDNCTDGWEIYWNSSRPSEENRTLNPLDGDDGLLDYDNDGWRDWDDVWHMFPNWREEEVGTNPWDPDTDNDGMSDGFEADN